jgi:L-lysine 2,3-aminomutase
MLLGWGFAAGPLICRREHASVFLQKVVEACGVVCGFCDRNEQAGKNQEQSRSVHCQESWLIFILKVGTTD